jgi:head-tail adaptor
MIRFVPGQQIKTFDVYEQEETTDGKGRVTKTPKAVAFSSFSGTISQASQKEIDRWKQTGHPITHTIVIRGTCQAEAENILKLGTRKFYVQGKDDPSELNIFQIIYCEERTGV